MPWLCWPWVGWGKAQTLCHGLETLPVSKELNSLYNRMHGGLGVGRKEGQSVGKGMNSPGGHDNHQDFCSHTISQKSPSRYSQKEPTMEEQNKEHNPGKHFFPPQALLFFPRYCSKHICTSLPAFLTTSLLFRVGAWASSTASKRKCQKCTLCIWTQSPGKAVGRLPFKEALLHSLFQPHCQGLSYHISLTVSTVYTSPAVSPI